MICKRCGENGESSYLQYWDANNVFSLAILQRFSVKFFEGVEELSQFNEDFTKNNNEESDEWYFFEVKV